MMLAVVLSSVAAAAAPPEPSGGALAGQRPRVIVSTDIGGSDPDDFQSMVHLLLYADVLDIEGLIASPPGKGRAEHILETIAAYEKDYPDLSRHSPTYPKPDALRAVTKQGAISPAPPAGFSEATEGSRWIIERSQAKDPKGRPLWILVWGSITDVAQAAHDNPTIKKSVRIYSIGSWNTAQDKASRNYLYQEHPDLWWIESDTTFRGMYMGGEQEGELGNRAFVERHVKGRGALGALYWRKKPDIKMGDTPSVLYLLRGNPDDPAGEHWGGAFVRPNPDTRATHWHDNPDPAQADAGRAGAKTVNKWRVHYLRDWQQRMARIAAIAPMAEP